MGEPKISIQQGYPVNIAYVLRQLTSGIKYLQQEEFEDTKWVIRIGKSKDRQYNGQKKKDESTNNLQNTTQKTKV